MPLERNEYRRSRILIHRDDVRGLVMRKVWLGRPPGPAVVRKQAELMEMPPWNTPLFSAAFQVVVDGLLAFVTGILIGSSQARPGCLGFGVTEFQGLVMRIGFLGLGNMGSAQRTCAADVAGSTRARAHGARGCTGATRSRGLGAQPSSAGFTLAAGNS
jgi:hypothetical protein